jgi:hypothetical protein
LKSDVTAAIEEDSDEEAKENENAVRFIRTVDNQFDTQVLKKSRIDFPYKSTNHICGTCVIVEQLFSRCGIIIHPYRRLMDPSTLEMLVLLRFKWDLWGKCEL